MLAEEWPLLLFTLLTQFAIGTFVILILIRSHWNQDVTTESQLIRSGILIAGPVMAVALVLSVLHLGSPFGAYRAILNIGSSWLSREILITGVFFGLLVLCIYTHLVGKTSTILEKVTAIVGVAAVYSTASLYTHSIRPAWIDINTYITFFSTTLVLGALGAIGSIVFGTKGKNLSDEIGKVLKMIIYIAVFAILIPILYMPIFIAKLSGGGSAAMESAKLLGGYAFPLLARWVLSLFGVGLLLYTLHKKDQSGQLLTMNMVYIGGSLVFAGEFIGRCLFYAIAVSVGIG